MAVTLTTTLASSGNTLHGYTFAQLKAAAKHAVAQGITDDEAGDIVNDAIQHLATLHPWTWRQSSLSLTVTADQEYADLPTDALEVQTLRYAADVQGYLQPSTIADLLLWRQGIWIEQLPTGQQFYAVGWQPQITAGDVPRARLELWPTPAESIADAIKGTYLRVIRKLTGEDEYPDMPAPFHQALKLLVRALAVSNQEQQEGEDWRLFQQLIPSFMRADGSQQTNLGMMRGMDRRQGSYIPTILPPS